MFQVQHQGTGAPILLRVKDRQFTDVSPQGSVVLGRTKYDELFFCQLNLNGTCDTECCLWAGFETHHLL